MTPSTHHLDRECRVFCQYLTGHPADDYVLAKYREGHRASHWTRRSVPDAFDALLLDRALRRPFMTRLADVYASLFFRRAVLRQKLVLVLAIVESRTPAFGALENATQQSLARSVGALTLRGVVFAGLAGCAVARFAPTHVRLRNASPGEVVPAWPPAGHVEVADS